MGIRCADHVTPLYPQKLALTSPTGGGRSVGIVRSRTKAMEFSSIVYATSFNDKRLSCSFGETVNLLLHRMTVTAPMSINFEVFAAWTGR